ncbi:MAG: GNAT family N-acetyltransferase, partial [Proteobacteria bacterium]|nr:GNAT family N-acetyltransferase [Pseudomonadota bacterium]
YLDHLNDNLLFPAVELYFNSLKEKLEPILGSDERAKKLLAKSVAADQCIAAVHEGKIIGILGVQTKDGGFVNPSLKTMTSIYGKIGGVIRLAGLALLYHRTKTGEVYVDGVAVHPAMRGKGIGTKLLEVLESKALEKQMKVITLDVIDTNPKAKALYKRLGFIEIKKEDIRPLNRFIKLPFKSVTFMEKIIA